LSELCFLHVGVFRTKEICMHRIGEILQVCDKICETYLQKILCLFRIAQGSVHRRLAPGLMYNFAQLKLAVPEY